MAVSVGCWWLEGGVSGVSGVLITCCLTIWKFIQLMKRAWIYSFVCMLHFSKNFNICLKNRCCRCLQCKELRKGSWPGGHCQGMEPKKMHRGRKWEVPGPPQREQRQHSPSPEKPRPWEQAREKQKRPSSLGRWTFLLRSPQHTACSHEQSSLVFSIAI